MYVSPRPTDSLKSMPTQKFLFEFPIEGFFYFRNFGSVSVIVISVFAFYYNRKLLLIRLREWKWKWKKKTFYLPTYPVFEGWVGQGETYIFFNVALSHVSTNFGGMVFCIYICVCWLEILDILFDKNTAWF